MTKQKAPAAKVTYQAKVYLSEYGRIEDVINGNNMPFLTDGKGSYFDEQGYPLIGTAEVVITLHSSDQIMQGRIDALQKQLEKHRADAYRAEQAILEKISKLSALTFDGEVVG